MSALPARTRAKPETGVEAIHARLTAGVIRDCISCSSFKTAATAWMEMG
jgi:hypothetical protein